MVCAAVAGQGGSEALRNSGSKGNNKGKQRLSQAAWQLASFPEKGKESRGWGKPCGVMQSRITVWVT